MAQYGKTDAHGKPDHQTGGTPGGAPGRTHESGNPMQKTDAHGNPVHQSGGKTGGYGTTGGNGTGAGIGGQQQGGVLQGGGGQQHQDKKGVVEKVKEKLPGQHQ